MTGLARIEARWKKATPGPWKLGGPDAMQRMGADTLVYGPFGERTAVIAGVVGDMERDDVQGDAEAIAAAPVDVRLLVAVAKAAEDLIQRADDTRSSVVDDVLSSYTVGLRAALAGLDGAP